MLIDRDDDWTRFIKRLHERRDELVEIVIVGSCSPESYARHCGSIAELDRMLALIREVRRGDDLRPPKPSGAPSVEE